MAFLIIAVISHFSRYDSHFIIKEIAKLGRISIFPINEERYVSFRYYDHKTRIKLRFVDSFKIMSFPFNQMKNMKIELRHLDENGFKLCRKGFFSCDYVNSVQNLSEKKLPSKRIFYNN